MYTYIPFFFSFPPTQPSSHPSRSSQYTLYYLEHILLDAYIFRTVLWCVLSHVRLFATPWTVAFQATLSIEFSRQEYQSGLPFPSPGNLPDPGIEPVPLTSPTLVLASTFFTTSATQEAVYGSRMGYFSCQKTMFQQFRRSFQGQSPEPWKKKKKI